MYMVDIMEFKDKLTYYLNDEESACKDFKKAVSLGHTSTEEWFKTDGAAWCRDM